MKTCLLFIVLISATLIGHAQGLSEWFNQNATQKKYLLQQIAALQVYTRYLQKGYSIAKKGLTTIGNIKNGHFSLDKDFFTSLESINPKIKTYARVSDIISMNIAIVKQHRQTMSRSLTSKSFNNNEIVYMDRVFTSLINGSTVIIGELLDLITESKLKMSDDERITRIDGLYYDMQDRYQFANNFSDGAGVMAVQRKQEQRDIKVVGTLYDHK